MKQYWLFSHSLYNVLSFSLTSYPNIINMNQATGASTSQGMGCSQKFWIHSLSDAALNLNVLWPKVKKALNFHSSSESLWRCSWTTDQTLHAAASHSTEWSPWPQWGYSKTGHTEETGVWHHQRPNRHPANQKDVQKQDPVDVSLNWMLLPQFHNKIW